MARPVRLDDLTDVMFSIDPLISKEEQRRREKMYESFRLCPDIKLGPCPRGADCPYRHSRGEKSVVCKHWLRGLCKKGNRCEFLHIFDRTKLPTCHFFTTFGECTSAECMFLHSKQDVFPSSECANYRNGFCKEGPKCPKRHIQRLGCKDFILRGFCSKGSRCPLAHPRFMEQMQSVQICTKCGKQGHIAMECTAFGVPQPRHYSQRPLSEVTCFKCGEKGHYANNCPNPATPAGAAAAAAMLGAHTATHSVSLRSSMLHPR